MFSKAANKLDFVIEEYVALLRFDTKFCRVALAFL